METEHLNERGRMFLETNRLADCSFYFPTSKSHITANKTILALASPIMETMFFSNSTYSEAQTSTVEMTDDIDVEVFKKFLSWIYAKELTLESVDEAIAVHQVANYYEVIDLEKMCTQHVLSNISTENVCSAWNLGDLYNESAVKSKCLEVVRSHTTEVLNSPNFRHLNVNALLVILEQDELWIKNEMALFKAVDKYARMNSLNRNQLDAAIKSIRFKVIQKDEHMEFVEFDSILLTEAEKLAIVGHKKLMDRATHYPDGFSKCDSSRCADYADICECDQRLLRYVKEAHYNEEEFFSYLNYEERYVAGTIANLMFRDLEYHTGFKIVSVLRAHLPRRNEEKNHKYLTRIFEDDNPKVIVALIDCLNQLSFPYYLEVPECDHEPTCKC